MLAHTLISILAIAASVTARPSRSVSPQKMNINTKRATPPPDECAFITDPVFPFQIASAANTYLPYMAWASIYGCLCESDIPSRVTGNEFTFVYIVNEVGVANTTIATKKARCVLDPNGYGLPCGYREMRGVGALVGRAAARIRMYRHAERPGEL
nr:RcOsp6 [Ceratobasidium cereale]